MVGALVVAVGTGLYFGVVRDSGGSSSDSLDGGGFDNLLTLDPCSYLDPDSFAGFADKGVGDAPAVRIEPTGFDSCAVELERSEKGGPRYTVTVRTETGYIVPSEVPDDLEVAERGAVQVTTADVALDCAQLIFRPDGTTVSVDTKASVTDAEGGYSRETLCRIQDIATDAAVAALGANTADRMAYPADSLGGTRPCSRLEDAEIMSATGAVEVSKRERDRDYVCIWSAGPASVTLAAKLVPTAADRPDGARETIAGRQSTIVDQFFFSNTETCDITLYGRTWTPWPGKQYDYAETGDDSSSGFIELTELSVSLFSGGSREEACRMARELAERAWPRLPGA
ncbi:hypothetical protein [Nocardia sp. NPDC127526]|uniref:hypothetical protein n=1 Tax=Nocardia sp. NPDC127526 TaxID=3345393 RepID=UPI003630D218